MKKIIVLIAVVSLITLSGMWSEVNASDGGDAAKLFESKCGLCHSIERPKSKTKTREGWESTVMRMKNSNGAPITEEEAGTIIDYLAEHYGK